MTTCVICNKRRTLNPSGMCSPCENKIKADTAKSRPVKPEKYVTYRGHVVGMYRNGDGNLHPRLLSICPDRLPKTYTINLDTFCEGYDRSVIKRLKACVLNLAHA